jgi:myo-inositol-1(or 4)-monophosphatase
MSLPDLASRIRAGQAAVLAQTELLHREFGRAQTTWKSDGTRVTPVDLAISDNIIAALRASFPDDEFFSEESAAPAPVALKARYAWILDPIDGTNNYATGIAYCAISVGLLEEGRPIYGFIYDLSRRVLMHGGPGQGLWDGTRAAGVKADPPQAQSLIGFHSPYDKRYAPHAQIVVERFKIRGLGSSALHLAYVAVGLLDGSVDHNVKVWDIAGAVPLCWAGGGDVQFLQHNPFPLRTFDLAMGRLQYVAGSPAMCAHLRAALS